MSKDKTITMEIFTLIKYKDECYEIGEVFKNLLNELEEKDKEIERLNNIINELKWKLINEYENPKYDWVLVKMFFKCDNFECIPRVAEKRFNHWYDANGYEIDEDMFEIKYFMDMQQIDKLYGLKGEYKKEVISNE